MKKMPEQMEKTLEKRMLLLSRVAALVCAENGGPEVAGRMPGMNKDRKLSRIVRRRGKGTAGKRQKRPRNRTKRRRNGERPVLILEGCMESCIRSGSKVSKQHNQ